MKQELEKRVSKLEAAQDQLMSEYEARQEVVREQQAIMRTVSYSNFYRSLQNKLQQVFLGCKVVSKGINTNNDTPSSTAVLQYVDVAGSTLLLPPAYFNLAKTTAASSSSSSLTVSMRELDEVTETVARRLTQMVGEQLSFVTGESAWLRVCEQGDRGTPVDHWDYFVISRPEQRRCCCAASECSEPN